MLKIPEENPKGNLFKDKPKNIIVIDNKTKLPLKLS
jgi:hypothetical protein